MNEFNYAPRLATLKPGEKGAITSPSYFLIKPFRIGTASSDLDARRREKRPIIAKRPLLISAKRRLAFCSSVWPSVNPNPRGSMALGGRAH